MKIRMGIITVQDADYHPNRRLLESAAKAGHQCQLIHPYRVWPMIQSGRFAVTGATSAPLPQVVLPRQGAEIKESCLALMRQLQWMGIPMINGVDAVTIARNKFLSQQVLTRAGIPCPDTIFVNDTEGFFRAVSALGGYPVVAKPVSGRQGVQVLRVTDDDDARHRILPGLDPQRGLMVQRYAWPDHRLDIRSLVVGGRVVGAVTLSPAQGDFRANFHLGSKLQPIELTHEWETLSIQAAAAVGCDVAGVDMMVDEKKRPTIVEVNYAPGFRGMEAATGRDIAGQIICFAVACCREQRQPLCQSIHRPSPKGIDPC